MSFRRLIIDDADPAMVYSGSWTTGTTLSSTSNEYNSTYHRSGTNGDSVFITFEGTSIEIFASLDTVRTKGTPGPLFRLDNGPPTRLNETGVIQLGIPNGIEPHIVVMRYNNLIQARHTLNITVDQVSNNGPFFYFDYVAITTNNLDASGYVIVDDRDGGWTYTGGSWGQNGVQEEFQGTTMQPPRGANTGSATYKFNGTDLTVYGTAGPSGTTTAQIGFAIDGNAQQSYSAPANAPAIFHIPWLRANSLEPREHTLTMTQLGDSDWFLDCLVYKSDTGKGNPNIPGSNDVRATSGGGGGGTNKGVIIGATIAGIVGLLAIGAIIYLLLRNRRRRTEFGEKGRDPIDEPDPRHPHPHNIEPFQTPLLQSDQAVSSSNHNLAHHPKGGAVGMTSNGGFHSNTHLMAGGNAHEPAPSSSGTGPLTVTGSSVISDPYGGIESNGRTSGYGSDQSYQNRPAHQLYPQFEGYTTPATSPPQQQQQYTPQSPPSNYATPSPGRGEKARATGHLQQPSQSTTLTSPPHSFQTHTTSYQHRHGAYSVTSDGESRYDPASLPIEMDSGIRIPPTAPPSYTRD